MDLRTSGNGSLPSAVSNPPSNSEVDFWTDFVNDKSSVNHSISQIQDSGKLARATRTRKEQMKQLLLSTSQSRPVSLARRHKDAAILRFQGSTTKKTKRRLFSVKNDFLHPSKLTFDRASPRLVRTAPRRSLSSSRVPGLSSKFGEQSLKKIIHKRGSSKEHKTNERSPANHKGSSSCPQSSLKGSAKYSSSQSDKAARTRRTSARIAQFEQKRQKHICDRKKLRESLEPESQHSQASVQDTSLGENSLNLQTILQTLTPYVQRLVQEKYAELHGTPNSPRHRSVKEQIAYFEEKRWRYIQNRRKSLESSTNLKRKQGGYTQEDNSEVQTDHQVTPGGGLDVCPVSPVFTALKPPTFFEPDKNQDQIHNCYDPSNAGVNTPRYSNASSPQKPLSASKSVQTAGIDTAGLRDTSILDTPTTNSAFQRTTSPKMVLNFKSPSANVIPPSVSHSCSFTPLLRRRLVRRSGAALGSSSQSRESDVDSLCSLSSVDAPTQHEALAPSPLDRSPPRATPWGSVRFMVNRVRHRGVCKPAAASERLFSSEEETDHEVLSARAAAKKFIGTGEAGGGSSADEDGAGVCSQQPAGKKGLGEATDAVHAHRHLGSTVDAGDENTNTDSVNGDSSGHNKERGPVDNESKRSLSADEDGGGVCSHNAIGKKDSGEGADVDWGRLGSTVDDSDDNTSTHSVDGDSSGHNKEKGTVDNESKSSFTSGGHYDECIRGDGEEASDTDHLDERLGNAADGKGRCINADHENNNDKVKIEAFHSVIDGELDMPDTGIGLFTRTEIKSLTKGKKHKKVVSVIRCSDDAHEEQNINVKTEAYDGAIDGELDISDTDIGRLSRTEKNRLTKDKKRKKVVSADICIEDDHENQKVNIKTEAYDSAVDGELDIADTGIGRLVRTEKNRLTKDKKHKKVVSVDRCIEDYHEGQNINVKTDAYDSAIDGELDIADTGIGRLARTEKKSVPEYKKQEKVVSVDKNKETNGPSTSDKATSRLETRKHKEVASVTELKKKSKGSSKSDQVTSSVETKKHKNNKSDAKINKKSKGSSTKNKKVKSVAKRKKKSKRSLTPDPVSCSVELREKLAKRTEANRAICQSMVPAFPEEWEEPAMSPAFLLYHRQFLQTKFMSLLVSRVKRQTDKPVKQRSSVTSGSKRAIISEQNRRLKMLTDEVEADGWISYDILPQIYKDPNTKSFIKRIK